MRKILIDNFRINDNVLITSFNPPLKGRVMDMYEIDSTMVPDETLKKMYPKNVPIFEIMLENEGKLRTFVKDVVKKA
jgi:hypothetical protein